MSRFVGPAVLAGALLSPVAGHTQSLSRVAIDSAVSADQFAGENTVARPNIIIDVNATVRLGDRWRLYVRPWFRQPRAPSWDVQIYQAALQYERPGRVSTRLDLGYLVSPIGLGMQDTRPGVNPTVAPHFTYFVPMPAFQQGAPRVGPMASSYPLGAQVSLSGGRWDARMALVSSAPTRIFVLNGAQNPRSTPVIEGGAGMTPRVGLRLGASFARGQYATGEELGTPGLPGRQLTMVTVEGEYAVGYTKLAGEVARDRFETAFSTATAVTWFLQATQTITPRWFVAAREEGTSAPPLQTATSIGARTSYYTVETAAGFRLTNDLTLRGSFVSRKAFTRTTWDQQWGGSLVWARRWW